MFKIDYKAAGLKRQVRKSIMHASPVKSRIANAGGSSITSTGNTITSSDTSSDTTSTAPRIAEVSTPNDASSSTSATSHHMTSNFPGSSSTALVQVKRRTKRGDSGDDDGGHTGRRTQCTLL